MTPDLARRHALLTAALGLGLPNTQASVNIGRMLLTAIQHAIGRSQAALSQEAALRTRHSPVASARS